MDLINYETYSIVQLYFVKVQDDTVLCCTGRYNTFCTSKQFLLNVL